jgi:hypothetical protein
MSARLENLIHAIKPDIQRICCRLTASIRYGIMILKFTILAGYARHGDLAEGAFVKAAAAAFFRIGKKRLSARGNDNAKNREACNNGNNHFAGHIGFGWRGARQSGNA